MAEALPPRLANASRQYAFPHTAADDRRRLEGVGADAELDIVQHGTPLWEFYKLSLEATKPPQIAAGVIDEREAMESLARLESPDFLACGFAHIGAWGRRQ
jgi:hypothetical protein